MNKPIVDRKFHRYISLWRNGKRSYERLVLYAERNTPEERRGYYYQLAVDHALRNLQIRTKGYTIEELIIKSYLEFIFMSLFSDEFINIYKTKHYLFTGSVEDHVYYLRYKEIVNEILSE